MSERKARAEHYHVLHVGNHDSGKLSHHGATTQKRLEAYASSLNCMLGRKGPQSRSYSAGNFITCFRTRWEELLSK